MKNNFSVIIPLYNKEAHILRALESVKNASEGYNVEVIIVNDGSTDNSRKIVEKYIKKDSNYKLINQPNQGVSEARNNGIKKAQNKYILLLDADDKWDKSFISYIDDLIKNFPDCGIYATAYENIFDEKNRKIPNIVNVPDYGIIQDYFDAVAEGHAPVWSSACCLDGDIFWKVGGFVKGETHGEDKALWGKIALEYEIARTSAIGSYRYWDADNRSESTWKPGGEWSFFPYAKSFMETHELNKKRENSLIHYLLEQRLYKVYRALKSGYFTYAVRELMMAVKLRNFHFWIDIFLKKIKS